MHHYNFMRSELVLQTVCRSTHVDCLVHAWSITERGVSNKIVGNHREEDILLLQKKECHPFCKVLEKERLEREVPS